MIKDRMVNGITLCMINKNGNVDFEVAEKGEVHIPEIYEEIKL